MRTYLVKVRADNGLMGIERVIDFARPRRMRCGRCGHEMLVDQQWTDRWEQALENCPKCGIDCTEEDRARPTYEPDGVVLDTGKVAHLSWYHTTTITDWPPRNYDPLSGFTSEELERMTSMMPPGGVDRWAERQKTKALHVGTYEAAIENMLRRMRDQPEGDRPFYLYRVEIHDTAGIEPGIHQEPTNFVGDAQPEEFMSPGKTIYRYVNEHEDPGGISLALTIDAIKSVTSVEIPLRRSERLEKNPIVSAENLAAAIKQYGVPNRLCEPLTGAIRGWISAHGRSINTGDLERFVDIIVNPERILAELDAAKVRTI